MRTECLVVVEVETLQSKRNVENLRPNFQHEVSSTKFVFVRHIIFLFTLINVRSRMMRKTNTMTIQRLIALEPHKQWKLIGLFV